MPLNRELSNIRFEPRPNSESYINRLNMGILVAGGTLLAVRAVSAGLLSYVLSSGIGAYWLPDLSPLASAQATSMSLFISISLVFLLFIYSLLRNNLGYKNPVTDAWFVGVIMSQVLAFGTFLASNGSFSIHQFVLNYSIFIFIAATIFYFYHLHLARQN